MLKTEIDMPFVQSFIQYGGMPVSLDGNGDLLLRFCSFAGVLLLAVFLLFLYFTLNKRKKMLELQQTQYEQLIEYTRMMEGLYENIMNQKHDFLNVLFAIKGYVEGEQWDEFKNLYHSIVREYESSKLENFLSCLNQVGHPGLKGILGYKLNHAHSLGINVVPQILTPIEIRGIDPLVLCRIIGILLDNAVEAAYESSEKELHIVMESDSLYTSIIISNTFRVMPDLSRLDKRGYSTKGEKRGIGLHNIKQMLSHTPSMTLRTSLENNMFIQELLLTK